MNDSPLRQPHRRIRLLWLAGAVAVLFAFLSGPSGLVSIVIRSLQVRRINSEIHLLHKQIAERTARRDWLANPDSATKYAHELLDPDSTTAGATGR